MVYLKTYEELLAEAHPTFKELDIGHRYQWRLLQWRPNITALELSRMKKSELGLIPGIGEKGVREIWEATHLDLFTLPRAEPKMEEYARRQTEALEKIEAALVTIVAGLQKQRGPALSADDLHALTRRGL